MQRGQVVHHGGGTVMNAVRSLLVRGRRLCQGGRRGLVLGRRLRERRGLEVSTNKKTLSASGSKGTRAAIIPRPRTKSKGSVRSEVLFSGLRRRVVDHRLCLRPSFSERRLVGAVCVPGGGFTPLFGRCTKVDFSGCVGGLHLRCTTGVLGGCPSCAMSAVTRRYNVSARSLCHLFSKGFKIAPASFRIKMRRVGGGGVARSG